MRWGQHHYHPFSFELLIHPTVPICVEWDICHRGICISHWLYYHSNANALGHVKNVSSSSVSSSCSPSHPAHQGHTPRRLNSVQMGVKAYYCRCVRLKYAKKDNLTWYLYSKPYTTVDGLPSMPHQEALFIVCDMGMGPPSFSPSSPSPPLWAF